MDYYSQLGLQRGATDNEIKKAYRSMAMKHHPDRGGDEKRFKEVEEAYRTLSDPQKKQIYDMGGDPSGQHPGGFHNRGPFEFHFGSGDMNDIFGNFGFGFGRQPLRRNRSINVVVDITLEDVLLGKDLTAEVAIPGGNKKMINLSIPPGIENGQQIRYQGMGDHTFKDTPPGDLIVNIQVREHHKFRREGDSLIYDHLISVWDAMLGTTLSINTLDGRTLNITVPSGTQPESILSCKEEGIPNMRTRKRGNLLIKIKIEIPKNLNNFQTEQIKKLKNDI
jgi:DnaJ-class molecular chaperone